MLHGSVQAVIGTAHDRDTWLQRRQRESHGRPLRQCRIRADYCLRAQMVRQRAPGRVGTARREGRRKAAGRLPPMVEHIRHMPHAPGVYAFRYAQCQIVVLAAIEPRPQPAQCRYHTAAVDRQMAHHVLRQQQIRIPSRLEIRPHAAAIHQLVLIGKQQVQAGGFGNFAGHRGQRMRRQQIVMIQERHVVAGGPRQRYVARGRNTAALRQMHDIDPVIRRQAGQALGHVRRPRGVVGNQQFPFAVVLREHGPYCRIQPFRIGFINRHHDTDGGRALQRLHARRPCRRVRLVLFHPGRIGAIDRRFRPQPAPPRTHKESQGQPPLAFFYHRSRLELSGNRIPRPDSVPS